MLSSISINERKFKKYVSTLKIIKIAVTEINEGMFI